MDRVEKTIGTRFLVVCFPADRHLARFRIYEIVGNVIGDPRPWFEGHGGCGMDGKSTPDIQHANTCAHGSVKWDGCVNWDTGGEGQIEVMQHECDLDGIITFGEALATAYRECAKMIPAWDGPDE